MRKFRTEHCDFTKKIAVLKIAVRNSAQTKKMTGNGNERKPVNLPSSGVGQDPVGSEIKAGCSRKLCGISLRHIGHLWL